MANPADFGAVAGQNASDAIDAALASLPDGGDLRVTESYRISRPIALPDGVRMVGASRRVTISEAGDFEGDCLVRCARRDVDNASVFDVIGLYHVGLGARSGIVGVDLAGTRHSTLHDVRLMGPGVNVAGSLAIRLSDRAPNGARCSCFFVNMRI